MTQATPTHSADYARGFNAGIDRARKVLVSRCAYVFDEALAKEKMEEPDKAAANPARIDWWWHS